MKISHCFTFLLTLFSSSVLLAAPITVGGDGNGSYGGNTDGAGNILIVGAEIATESEIPSETYDLATSTFNFFASPAASNRTVTPFVATFAGGTVTDFNNYDVIAVGDPYTVGALEANTSLSIPFQAAPGSITINNSDVVVGGIDASGSFAVGFGGGPAESSRIILQGNADVTNDISVTGANWSGNNGVNNRIYDFDIDLQPLQVNEVPEPSSFVAITIIGLLSTLCFLGRRITRKK